MNSHKLLWTGLCALMLVLPTAAALMQGSATTDFITPSTTDFLILGLAVVALILGIWTVRMIVRFRTLRQDEATLEALEGADSNR